MRYIEALEQFESSILPTLFVAGSINGAPDWQAKYRSYFEDTNCVLLNPRRALVNHPEAWDGPEGQRQIDWEFDHLRKVDAVSFWFAAEGRGFSSALELGAALERHVAVFVGVHPLYWKESTIAYQAKKRRPDLVIAKNLVDLANQVRVHFGYEPLRELGTATPIGPYKPYPGS